MNNYFNHSGGAQGADMEWDRIGREFGFENHRHYSAKDLKSLSPEVRAKLESDVLHAAIILQRPTTEFPGKDLVRRNWFQAYNAEGIYAVARIVNPGEKDKGFVNNTGRQIVSGGTGWAVQMGINMRKAVNVFNMNDNKWYVWHHEKEYFMVRPAPILLPKNYAGIGSRILTDEAKQAIRNVYEFTLNYIKIYEPEILQTDNGDT
jgi:hypothetical protein